MTLPDAAVKWLVKELRCPKWRDRGYQCEGYCPFIPGNRDFEARARVCWEDFFEKEGKQWTNRKRRAPALSSPRAARPATVFLF